ncbi:hypothetical protein PR202_ga07081 [Eleusine coracana subsp. coracana]|uniref:Cyclic nucleotide-binding domain-containing protein n=1 Tax=Eleusine coracana subsp. coracana TaxID=191504 RepID=A0AAV5BYQ7_ELECO|nr:hypothetical protein PR202_ga07081 [Eleusine coracana subsp. coracana]
MITVSARSSQRLTSGNGNGWLATGPGRAGFYSSTPTRRPRPRELHDPSSRSLFLRFFTFPTQLIPASCRLPARELHRGVLLSHLREFYNFDVAAEILTSYCRLAGCVFPLALQRSNGGPGGQICEDWRSEQSVGSDRVVSERGHTVFGLLKDTTTGAFSFLGNSSRSETLNKSASEERKPKTRVLDPQGPFLQRWNKIFVISCLVAVFVDPLFLYIPIINGENNCLYLDEKLEKAANLFEALLKIDMHHFNDLHSSKNWTWSWEHIEGVCAGCAAPSTRVLELFGTFFLCNELTSVGEKLAADRLDTYLQSASTRIEEMRMKRRDTEQWMAHRLLPENLKERIMRHEQYKWQETRGVDEEGILANLPKDLRREIKRHLCLSLLMKVPMFENMDEQLLDAMCDRLKPMLYTEGSCIIREGDPVNEMLFIMRGTLESMTTNGGQTGFFNSNVLKGGDFCGEELLTWALDPTSYSNLPGSTRTVRTLTEVEAFALRADDLKFVATQFRRLHSKQLQHTFRFYSQQWRTWAACFIQAAWHRYCRKKLEETLFEKEKRLQAAIVCDGTSSLSLGAALYASRFAGNMMRILRRNATRKARLQERVPVRLLQKPAEPNFFVEDR